MLSKFDLLTQFQLCIITNKLFELVLKEQSVYTVITFFDIMLPDVARLKPSTRARVEIKREPFTHLLLIMIAWLLLWHNSRT